MFERDAHSVAGISKFHWELPQGLVFLACGSFAGLLSTQSSLHSCSMLWGLRLLRKDRLSLQALEKDHYNSCNLAELSQRL